MMRTEGQPSMNPLKPASPAGRHKAPLIRTQNYEPAISAKTLNSKKKVAADAAVATKTEKIAVEKGGPKEKTSNRFDWLGPESNRRPPELAQTGGPVSLPLIPPGLSSKVTHPLIRRGGATPHLRMRTSSR